VPKEDLVACEVEAVLAPFTTANGGPLVVRKFTYVPDRSNVIIHYPGTTDRIVSFVGSHMDTVPADPEQWSRDPFTMERDGDKIYGRGVTDCLGHVAMLTLFFKKLAELKPTLEVGVAAVLIANEENSEIPGVGIDELERRGELAFLKNGPLIWLGMLTIEKCMIDF
jgi:acetylornithine deacetylase